MKIERGGIFNRSRLEEEKVIMFGIFYVKCASIERVRIIKFQLPKTKTKIILNICQNCLINITGGGSVDRNA